MSIQGRALELARGQWISDVRSLQASPIAGERRVKARLLAGVVGALAVALPASAQQQEEEGDPAAGRELALELCTACHIVGPEQVGSDAAPPFAAIAKDPEITMDEMHGWGGPGHPVLPELALTPQQTADINAYLDRLRAGPAEPEEEEPPPEGASPRLETEEPPPAVEQAPPEQRGPPVEVEPE